MKINFIYKINLLIFLLLTAFVTRNECLFGQKSEIGSPFIRNIHPKEYGYESQNYSIVQDSRGVIYISNLSGILEYDGTFWKFIKVQGASDLGIGKDGTVMVGGFNEFGYLAQENGIDKKFISVSRGIKESFGNISHVIATDSEVLFLSSKKIFRWDNDKTSVADSSKKTVKAFKAGNQLYFHNSEKGLCKYDNGKLLSLKNGDYFKEKPISAILPYNSRLLIKISNAKGFVIYDQNSIIQFNTDADDFLEKNEFTCGVILSNGDYAFGTKRNGIIIVNKSGRVIRNIDKQSGLYNDYINDLFVDSSNKLWAATNNGVSIIEFPSAYTYFNQSAGLKGGAASTIRHNGVLYVATTLGVYYLTGNSTASENVMNSGYFLPVKGILSRCYNLYCIKRNLFVTSDDGVYAIDKFEGRLVSAGLLRTIFPAGQDSSLLFLGKNNGLAMVKYDGKNWKETGFLENFNYYYARTIAKDKNGNLWLGSDYTGVFEATFPNGYSSKANILHFTGNNGLPAGYDWVDVYSIAGEVLFSTSKGMYRFNETTGQFYPDTLLGIDFSKGAIWVFPIIEMSNKNLLWSSGTQDKFEKNTVFARYDEKQNKYFQVEAPFKKISQFTVEHIFHEKDSVIWFCGFDGLIRFDYPEFNEDTAKFLTLIRSIIIGKDSAVNFSAISKPTGNELNFNTDSLIPRFSYKYHTIKFEFSSPCYDQEHKISYKYFLEGFDKNWSDWTPNTVKEYTNLPSGEYIFRVMAKNANENISLTATYCFSVSPPFYFTWWAFIVYFVLLVSFVLMIINWRNYLFEKEKNRLEKIIVERTEELVKQKERAEELVQNILPKQTAEELSSVGKASRKKYKMVTVLFSDVKGFSKIAEHMNPDVLLDELDRYFLYFDSVVERLNIEKIKTIGDAYMCAGGIPQKNRTNPIDVVMAALEMQRYMKERRGKSENEWDVRIGIHTGPVIAGVVGSKKYSYDIWGDTVNIASRMESSGKVGEINISELTFELVKDYFDCEHRGKIPVKHKGEIGMYFIKGLKPDYSIDGMGIIPNSKFINRLQYIRFDDLDELVMTKLEMGLPKNLYYHNLKHTIDVCTQVEILGRAEKLNDDDMLLLKTAAIFHDSGFLIGYDDHEALGIKMAKEILPKFQYSDEQIKIISDLIYATKSPPTPRNLLEQIMCDADLDYLGRTDFLPVSQNLFRELFERNKIKSIDEWNRMQIKFIEGHQYFTEAARKMRNVNKMNQLEKLRALV